MSNNRVVLRPRDGPGELTLSELLQSATPIRWGRLTYLHVEFMIHSFYVTNISQWRHVCTELGNHLPPSQLILIVDFIQNGSNKENLAIIKDMLDPMLGLPLLKRVSLNIDGRAIAGLPLHHKARQVLHHLVVPTAPSVGPLSFRFMDLPLELRLMILEYPDFELVAPSAITHSGLKGFALLECSEDNACANSNSESECSERTLYRSSKICWSLPLDLLLVSKAFSELCCFIFFSRNHLVIPVLDDNLMANSIRDRPKQRLNWKQTSIRIPDGWNPRQSRFLSNFPPDCIGDVRSLEFRFPMFGDTVKLSPSGEYDWKNTIDFIAQNARLSDLSITLDMETTDIHPRQSGKLLRHHRRSIMRQVAGKSREDVVAPMTRLRGLRDFFVNTVWSQNTSPRLYEELRLERQAMGENFHLTTEEWAAGRIFEFEFEFNTQYCHLLENSKWRQMATKQLETMI
ncbi:hypothetical protein V8E54_011870 [Elaphomyces granulatus]